MRRRFDKLINFVISFFILVLKEFMGGFYDEVEYGKFITKKVAQLLSGHSSK